METSTSTDRPPVLELSSRDTEKSFFSIAPGAISSTVAALLLSGSQPVADREVPAQLLSVSETTETQMEIDVALYGMTLDELSEPENVLELIRQIESGYVDQERQRSISTEKNSEALNPKRFKDHYDSLFPYLVENYHVRSWERPDWSLVRLAESRGECEARELCIRLKTSLEFQKVAKEGEDQDSLPIHRYNSDDYLAL